MLLNLGKLLGSVFGPKMPETYHQFENEFVVDVKCRLVVSGVHWLNLGTAPGVRVTGGQRQNSLIKLTFSEQRLTIQVCKRSQPWH